MVLASAAKWEIRVRFGRADKGEGREWRSVVEHHSNFLSRLGGDRQTAEKVAGTDRQRPSATFQSDTYGLNRVCAVGKETAGPSATLPRISCREPWR
jgi:hypothetical protein